MTDYERDRYIVENDHLSECVRSSTAHDQLRSRLSYQRVLGYCSQTWDAVKRVLCFDVPEGNTLEKEDTVELDAGSKEALSFCWRALKESR